MRAFPLNKGHIAELYILITREILIKHNKQMEARLVLPVKSKIVLSPAIISLVIVHLPQNSPHSFDNGV